ncbi:type VII secretion integral membrane protein EccD [Mycobacterium sp. C31M]
MRTSGLRAGYGEDVLDEPLCRVTIQRAWDNCFVDLSVPRHAPLGLLLPDIAALVTDDAVVSADWRLDRLAGGRCDEALSLHDSGVHDGDVIMLSRQTDPAPGPVPVDIVRELITADSGGPPRAGTPSATWWIAGASIAVALCLSGRDRPIVGILLALGSAVGCLFVHRRTGRSPAAALGIVFLGAAAFQVLPGVPGPPQLLLATAVCATAAVAVLRTGGDPPLFTAIATVSALATVATVAAVALDLDTAAHGAILAGAALGVLGMSGRLALGMSGLRPGSVCGADTARDRLAGLVCGSAAAGAGATALIAVGCARGAAPWPPGVALTAVIAGVLLIRGRLYADPRCGAAVGWSGLAGALVTLALMCVVAPGHAGWPAVTVFAAAAWYRLRPAVVSPALARTVDVVECVLLAAAIPLACWVAGGYDLVQSASPG